MIENEIYEKQKVDIQKLTKESIIHKKYIKHPNNVLSVVKAVEDGAVSIEGMCNYFTVDEVIHDLGSNTFFYKITITTDYCTSTVTIPKQTVTNRRFSDMTAHGLSINEKLPKDFLEYVLLSEKEARFVEESSKIGWNEGHFCGYEDDENHRCTNRVKLSTSDEYSLEELNKLLDGAEYLQLAFDIAASSAVQGRLGQELPLSSMIYHFYGDSSQGKTTALLTTSVWGKPTVEDGLFSTWNQTELSFMNLLGNNYGVTVALDESSICRFDLTTCIYNISQGINRQRLQKTLQQQPTKQWNTTIMSSGESSLLENSKNNTGLKARAIEFSEAVTLSAEHSNKCKKFFLSNYGHIGKQLVEMLESTSLSDLVEQYEAEKEAFLKAVPEGERHSLTDRLAESFAILTLTSKFLTDIGVKISDLTPLLVKKNMEIGCDQNIGKKVYNAICERVIRKRQLYPEIGNEAACIGIEGIITSKNELVMLEAAFNETLQQNKFTSRLVCLKALDKIGVLIKQRSDTYYSKRKVSGINAKIVVLKFKVNKTHSIDKITSLNELLNKMEVSE